MTRWQAVHVGFDSDDLELGGLAVWKHDWRDTGETLTLPHPAYPHQMHGYRIYEIGNADRPIRFATAELSNGVWGFYTPL